MGGGGGASVCMCVLCICVGDLLGWLTGCGPRGLTMTGNLTVVQSSRLDVQWSSSEGPLLSRLLESRSRF